MKTIVTALLFGASVLVEAKGPLASGTYVGESNGRLISIELGIYNIPGTTTRIRSCNVHPGCSRADTLASYNPYSKRQETYLRELVFTDLRFNENFEWEVDYASIDSYGRVHPMATLVFGPLEQQISTKVTVVTDELGAVTLTRSQE